jgi:23S rRNA (guanosine2251-2'-O)-methyltransferase
VSRHRKRPAKGASPAAGTQCLSGTHAVCESLAAGRRRLQRLYVADTCTDSRCRDAVARAEARGVAISRATDDDLSKLAGTRRHQGLCLEAAPLPTLDLVQFEDLLDSAARPSTVMILDQITDPHNLGALMRTALCTGVSAIVLAKDRSAGLTPSVSRASAGAMEHMTVARVPNLSEAIRRLKDRGFWVAGLDRDQGSDIFDTSLPTPMALVVGSEGQGIRPLVKSRCDLLLAIPQEGHLNSLNASVAGAVALYELFRRRRSNPL